MLNILTLTILYFNSYRKGSQEIFRKVFFEFSSMHENFSSSGSMFLLTINKQKLEEKYYESLNKWQQNTGNLIDPLYSSTIIFFA